MKIKTAHTHRTQHTLLWVSLWMAVVALLVMLSACRSSRSSEPGSAVATEAFPTELPSSTPTRTLTPTPAVTPTPTPDPNISPLTGQHVDDLSLIHRRVLAVRVGNDPEARPQEGLGLADIVYEEVMDGWGVTRFTALFLESDAERVRPIRSARLSGLEIVPQYDAAYAHSGASDGVRWKLSQSTMVNLDEFFHPAPYRVLAGYDWRSRMYTSTELLRAHLEASDLEREEPIEGYPFDETPPVGDPAEAVHIPYPASSTVDWAYDAESGRYLRFVRGSPHLEALTGEQIAADNVIILYAEHRGTNIVEDVNGATAIDIVLSGAGQAQVVRDGVVVDATWVRENEDKPIQYYDADDNLISLRPGKTWIQLVPQDYEVTVE